MLLNVHLWVHIIFVSCVVKWEIEPSCCTLKLTGWRTACILSQTSHCFHGPPSLLGRTTTRQTMVTQASVSHNYFVVKKVNLALQGELGLLLMIKLELSWENDNFRKFTFHLHVFISSFTVWRFSCWWLRCYQMQCLIPWNEMCQHSENLRNSVNHCFPNDFVKLCVAKRAIQSPRF